MYLNYRENVSKQPKVLSNRQEFITTQTEQKCQPYEQMDMIFEWTAQRRRQIFSKLRLPDAASFHPLFSKLSSFLRSSILLFLYNYSWESKMCAKMEINVQQQQEWSTHFTLRQFGQFCEQRKMSLTFTFKVLLILFLRDPQSNLNIYLGSNLIPWF